MALLLPEYKTIFFHVPKTGGNFIETYLKSKTKVIKLGYKHSPVDMIGPLAYNGQFKFCFIRNPVDWYKSYFQYRVGKWKFWEGHILYHPCWEIDPHCGSDNFDDFVDKCLNLNGYLNRMYERFIGAGRLKVNFVGKTENLADDLIKVLNIIGIKHNPNIIRRLPKVNESKKIVTVSAQTREKIKKIETLYYES